MSWEVVVGLEIHAQLVTRTKAFCRCPNQYGAAPNTLVCPTCLGMPGALPVLNEEVVSQATKLALALGATVHPHSKFDRKNYFYPDLPKGYQISQYDEPFSTGGFVEFELGGETKRIRVTRAHIEEDAGKSQHLADGTTVVDMNRCGVPLVEIVSEPELRSPAEAGAYVRTVRDWLRAINVCDGNMEQGSLRCDANISVRRAGELDFNERREVKNLNSISNLEQVIVAESEWQIKRYEAGETVKRMTLLWDEGAEIAREMRRKEGSDDYRYFPEPDLPELTLDAQYIEGVRASMWLTPRELKAELMAVHGWNREQVQYLFSSAGHVPYVRELVQDFGADPKSVASFYATVASGIMNERGWSPAEFSQQVPAASFAKVISYQLDRTISFTGASAVIKEIADTGAEPDAIISARGLRQISDRGVLRQIVEQVLEQNPDAVLKHKPGEDKLVKFLVGRVIQATNKSANPAVATELVRELLDSRKAN
ncbi:Asp-tRNA(Asn)/Glu-tRNA(Gln) amidotransferase subunit GatB [candidate division KSB1 bacterium]|nr:Asp-tRNA(Asn)/Glu-tRNA(Gln) amidotransferase subunit GatB [candidate division KSB1 bacterium]